MGPSRSRGSGVDSDTSMMDAPEPIKQLEVDPMVSQPTRVSSHSSKCQPWLQHYTVPIYERPQADTHL
jgi:hypothetical protein